MLATYRIDIFVADPKGNIPLWAKESGCSPVGLDYLIESPRHLIEELMFAKIKRLLDEAYKGVAAGAYILNAVLINDKQSLWGAKSRSGDFKGSRKPSGSRLASR